MIPNLFDFFSRHFDSIVEFESNSWFPAGELGCVGQVECSLLDPESGDDARARFFGVSIWMAVALG
jgi:hypothetical protein